MEGSLIWRDFLLNLPEVFFPTNTQPLGNERLCVSACLVITS